MIAITKPFYHNILCHQILILNKYLGKTITITGILKLVISLFMLTWKNLKSKNTLTFTPLLQYYSFTKYNVEISEKL